LLLTLVPRGVSGPALLAIVYIAEGMPVVGVAFLAPGVLLAAGWTMRRLTRRTGSAALRLAALHLSRTPVRGGATIGTGAAALGIACGLAVLVASFQRAWLDWIEQHFAADLFVGSGGHVRLLAGPVMGPEVASRVAAVPGVASVEPFRVIQIRLRGRPVFLQGISVRDRLAHGGLPMFEGSLESAAAALESGEAALVSDNLAVKLGLLVGDVIELPTPAGTHRVRVAGTFVDFLGSLDLGAVAVSTDLLRRIWHDEGANLLRLWIRPGAVVSDVRRGVVAALGAGDGYYVLTGRAFVDGVRGVLDQFFRAGWVLIVIAACIGVVSIANTQVATMLDRAPDNATLYTIGIPRRALARGVLIECGVLGLLGGLLGVVVSLVLGMEITSWTLLVLTGWRIPLHVPAGQLLGAVVAATVVAAMAGWIPARLATRVRPGSGGMA
jgi:putative ABC transport system permease protein